MNRSPESMQRQLEYARRLRASRMAQGLNTKGRPRQRAPVTPHRTSHEQNRALALEALLWISDKKWRTPAELVGLHAFAANLPLAWWAARRGCSIIALVDLLEKERQRHFPPSTGPQLAHGPNPLQAIA